MAGPNLGLHLLLLLSFSAFFGPAESRCSSRCDLALASYYVWKGSSLSFIAVVMKSNILTSAEDLVTYNSAKVSNKDSLPADIRINVPFPCDCINGEFLGHVFEYSLKSGDTYGLLATRYYANLTTVSWLEGFNNYTEFTIPDSGTLKVVVNCSCGDKAVSEDYGLFLTYPLRPGETLESVASDTNTSTTVLTNYNVGVNFSQGSGLVYIPARDLSGTYRPLQSSTGLSGGAIAGICAAVVAVFLLLGCFAYVTFYRKKKVESNLLLTSSQDPSAKDGVVTGSNSDEPVESNGQAPPSSGRIGITVDKSVKFSYKELATATNDFSLANKIGEGGFGSVYYAELRGERAAIKKMDTKASKEFLAELKVSTRVHHLNLVRLIGYCAEGSLFLVYEYIENGNLSQHLRGTEKDPLPWSTRVQIALDSARGLEYIHEHTDPVYIHRDIKSANILIDKNFRGKVADFGLTKLKKVGSASTASRLVGTFGYMPPEYTHFGSVSPKVDVYAFGVVLYELISAKEAIIKGDDSTAEPRSLVRLFEEVLNQPDPRDDLHKLIDPRLGDDCPLDSVRKMAQLAKACTQENPELRPSMKAIAVALMALTSSTEDWDVGFFYENQALVNPMSGG